MELKRGEMISLKMIIGVSSVVFIFLLKYSRRLYKKNLKYNPLNGISKFVGFFGLCMTLIVLDEDIKIVTAILITTFMFLVLIHRKLGLIHSVIFSILQVLSTPASLLWGLLKILMSLIITAIENRGIYGVNVNGHDPYSPRQSRVNKKSIALSNINKVGNKTDEKSLKEL